MESLKTFLNNCDLKNIKNILNPEKINIWIDGYTPPPLYYFILKINQSLVSEEDLIADQRVRISPEEGQIADQEFLILDNYFKMVKLLIDYGANVNYIWNGKNLLSIMCNSHRDSDETLNIIKLLLDNKAEADNSSLRHPAITYAACMNNHKVFKLLLENKVKITSRTINYYKYWFDNDYANDYSNITKLLLEHIYPEILPQVFLQRARDVILMMCNYGCLNGFKQIITILPNLKEECMYYLCDDIILFMSGHDTFCDYGPEWVSELTLLEIVIMNINIFEDYDCSCRNNILGDGKDLNNYIEIAKILIDLGADTNIEKMPTVLVPYIMEAKNTLRGYLLDFLSKVLVDMVINYIYEFK
jgi:hypothetical protein